jgi:CheY-like chemotaxis protein
VAFTAWGQPQDRARAEEAGFQAHLLKPVEPRILVETVARLVGRPRPGRMAAGHS